MNNYHVTDWKCGLSLKNCHLYPKLKADAIYISAPSWSYNDDGISGSSLSHEVFATFSDLHATCTNFEHCKALLHTALL